MAHLVFAAAEHVGILLNGGSIKSYFFKNVASEARAMHLELESMVESLVEKQQTTELSKSEQVGSLSTELRRIAYDAEDVTDNYVFAMESYSNLSRVAGKVRRARHTYKKLRTLREVIREVKATLDECVEESNKESSTNSPNNMVMVGDSHDSQSSDSIYYADSGFAVGIEDDVEKLVNKVWLEHNKVLAIVGMAGSGKTTLARSFYHHNKIKWHFKYRVWVSLGQGLPMSEVPSEICGQLQKMVESSCFWLRFWPTNCLIVLDNLWDTRSFKDQIPILFKRLEAFQDPFKEIKIVIISRHNNNEFSDEWYSHKMRLLNEKDSWDLFTKVSSNALAQEYHHLAKEILDECERLPLAIVVLGKLLKNKDTRERVLSQLKTKEGPKDMFLPVNNILARSYHNLPLSLKPCFLYFGLFPKKSPIKAGRLMRMWSAEGFVKCSPEETLEDAARELLQMLIDCTMVQVIERTYAGKPKTLQVHTLMTDLCLREAQKLDFLTACSSESTDQTKQTRRTSVNIRCNSTLPVDNSLLRSLLVYDQGVDDHHTRPRNQRANLDLEPVFKRFKLLRVLDITGIETSDGTMPQNIGNLVHLRYLRIRSTNITKLPESIRNLINLITLVYRNVKVNNNGINLPNVLWKLTNLRHLYLPLEETNTTENLKLCTLKNLQTLWGVRAGNWMRNEMPNLSPKVKKMCIQGIKGEKLIVDSVFNCPVIQKHDHLESLALEWFGFSLRDLGPLCSKEHLLKLKLKGQAPDDLKPLNFPFKLQKLELYYTQLGNPNSLADLGKLPSLKFLKLAKDSYNGSEWVIKDQSAFPQLEVLLLSNLPNLEKWEGEKGMMQCLMKLSVKYCPRLEQIPKELTSRHTLEILFKRKDSHLVANSAEIDNIN